MRGEIRMRYAGRFAVVAGAVFGATLAAWLAWILLGPEEQITRFLHDARETEHAET
jgi:hypothetical protein